MELKDTLYTISIAITFIVGIFNLFISCYNLKINRNKLRIDLYNKRFSVYEKTLSYFISSTIPGNKTVESMALIESEFTRSYRESIFLFGKNSPVHNTLTKIKDTISQPISNHSNLHTLMLSLEEELIPWLDFKKIENTNQ